MLITSTLLLVGDKIIPDAVTASLGVQPHRAQIKGATVTHAGGRTTIAKTGFWSFQTGGLIRSEDLQDHIMFFVDLASIPLQAFRVSDMIEIITVSVIVGDFPKLNYSSSWSADLSKAVIAGLGHLGANLSLTVLHPEVDS